MMRAIHVAVMAGILLSGCGGKRRVAIPAAPRIGSNEVGLASWYGRPYHGRRAANGEIYDMEKMTAAHRTLPFGTWLQVRNLTNNRTVEVRIIDRGPFVGGRILDLSHAAAVSLDMIGPGTAKVKITVMAQPPQTVEAPVVSKVEPVSGQFAVQAGAFADRRNAERVQSAMEKRYGSAKIVMRDGQPPQWRVLVGHEETETAAEELAARIRNDADAGSAGAFVVRLDPDRTADSI